MTVTSQNDVGFIQGAGGSPRPEAKAASGVPGARSTCSECEAAPIQEGGEGMGAGRRDNQGMQQAGCRCLCSVWTERAEALSQRAECALLEWSLNSLLSEAPKGLREEAP